MNIGIHIRARHNSHIDSKNREEFKVRMSEFIAHAHRDPRTENKIIIGGSGVSSQGEAATKKEIKVFYMKKMMVPKYKSFVMLGNRWKFK